MIDEKGNLIIEYIIKKCSKCGEEFKTVVVSRNKYAIITEYTRCECCRKGEGSMPNRYSLTEWEGYGKIN